MRHWLLAVSLEPAKLVARIGGLSLGCGNHLPLLGR
jgi:hypothetical protein